MKHYILIRIKTNKKSELLLKFNKINVDIRNINYKKDGLELEILDSDLKRVRKYLVSYKIEVISDTGIYEIKRKIYDNSLLIVGLIFGVIVFLLLSNVVVKVNVHHDSKEMRELLYEALEEKGVKPLTFKKSYKDYEEIILDIKNNFKDKIEWLEIEVTGMVINVRVEERIINDYQKEYAVCNVVAAKSGIIRKVFTEKGVTEVRINDFVQKDDILINGIIKLNDEVKNKVCAKGRVMAEVWYNVNVTLPLSYQEEEFTGKKRFNFMVKVKKQEYVILKSRVNNKKVKNIRLFKIFGIEFYIQKEYEIKINSKKYTEEEAIKVATELVHEKLAVKSSESVVIINEKYLKKSINNDNLDIAMFIAVEEQIGIKQYVEETESDTDVEEYNGDNS